MAEKCPKAIIIYGTGHSPKQTNAHVMLDWGE